MKDKPVFPQCEALAKKHGIDSDIDRLLLDEIAADAQSVFNSALISAICTPGDPLHNLYTEAATASKKDIMTKIKAMVPDHPKAAEAATEYFDAVMSCIEHLAAPAQPTKPEGAPR